MRYPDYYGIDMAKMDEFIAFRAAIALHRDRGMEARLMEIYEKCKAQEMLPKEEVINYVREVYEPFTSEDISEKMARMLRPEGVHTEIHIVFQSLEGLHRACPHSPGDWYFSGHYPTPGGNKRVNEAYINYIEKHFKPECQA